MLVAGGIRSVGCIPKTLHTQADLERRFWISPFCSEFRITRYGVRRRDVPRFVECSDCPSVLRNMRGGGVGEIGEGELRAKLRAGERVTGIIVVAREVDDALEYTPFLLLSWRRGYFRIVRWRGGERRYREFGRLLKLLRDFGWMASVPVFDAADPKLRRVRAIAHALGVPPTPRKRPGGVPAGDPDAASAEDELDGPDEEAVLPLS